MCLMLQKKIYSLGLLWVLLLRSTPPGCSMDLGQGYDDNDRLCRSSLSQHLMQQVLSPYLLLAVSLCMNPHVCLIDNSQTLINSVDTFLYPYTLPLESTSLKLLKPLPKLQPELQLKVVTATIQDGGTRERRGDSDSNILCYTNISSKS